MNLPITPFYVTDPTKGFSIEIFRIEANFVSMMNIEFKLLTQTRIKLATNPNNPMGHPTLDSSKQANRDNKNKLQIFLGLTFGSSEELPKLGGLYKIR